MPVTRARRPSQALAAGLIGLIVVLGWQSPSFAHAELLSTNPVDGSVVPVAPQEVRLNFSEPVQVRPGGVRLLTSAGADTGASSRAVDTAVILDVPPGSAHGTYIVTWRVISADGHPVAGGFSFSIGAPTPGTVAVPAAAPPSGWLRAVRLMTEAFGYLGTLGAAGLIVFAMLIAPRPAVSLHRRMRRIAFGLGGLAVVSAVAAIPVNAAWQDGATTAALFTAQVWRSGDQAAVAALIAVGLGLSLAALAAGARPAAGPPGDDMAVLAHGAAAEAGPSGAGPDDRVAARVGGGALPALACGGAALAVGAFALAGHTRTFGPAWLVLGTDLTHVAAAAIWLGGIAGVTLLLARSSGTDAPSAAGAVSRFSAAAAGVVVALAIAGVLLGWRILGTWDALFGTGYGRTLLIKAGIASAIVGLAALNRFRLLPRIRSGRDWHLLRRAVGAEAVLLVAVVAVTGLLVTQSPTLPQGPRQTGAANVLRATLGPAGQAALSVTPGRVGANSLALSLRDAGGAAIEPIETPAMRVRLPARDVGPLPRELSRVGPGRYEAVGEFPLNGSWTVEVSVRLSTFDNPVALFTVDIP